VSARPFIVIKLGGEVIRGEALPEIAAEIAALARDPALSLVLVHGGGPQTTDLQKALGQTPRVVGGRRITDDAALEAIKMAVVGVANVDLCAALHARGVRAVGLHGASCGVIAATRRPPRVVHGAGPDPIDLGHVGDVVGFDRALLERLTEGGFVPVLACLGSDSAGQLYNINADIVATRLAIELAARDLVLLMDAPGVLEKLEDPASRLPELTIAEARRLCETGVVSGGMLPKLEESFVALERGVERVHLVNRAIARAVAQPGSVGTVLRR
jgi:acetylglutamate kinase